MSLSLPPPIALYITLENAGDTETLSECFAPNAIVRDEDALPGELGFAHEFNIALALPNDKNARKSKVLTER